MEPFFVDETIESEIRSTYSCPRIHEEWIRETARRIVEDHGQEPDFGLTRYRELIHQTIGSSPFSEIAEPGTGLPNRINQPKVNTFIKNPVVLELVHMIDIGVSAVTLERVRQDREHSSFLDRMARTAGTAEAKALRDQGWLRPTAEKYPRKRLKLYLSDGSIELQAIELEQLPFELGCTPMGTKIRLSNFPIIGGIAYIANDNILDTGGLVEKLQKRHHHRLHDELSRLVDEDDLEAQVQPLPSYPWTPY